ncbi:extracellular metalloproteinase MEP [Ceratobasidium sp. AG-Ba]|nr:extracellular metalloproteinase MEP [Ceratobasidium sp. AG-Ba]
MGFSRHRLFTSLALAGLTSLTQAHGTTRKSLSFKQPLPNTKFITDPPPISSFAPRDAHPHATAHWYIKEHIGGVFNYYVRNDSYTDRNTGISHVYVRQLVNGIEVADGDMNFNVRDGHVLSYGSSVFTGGQSDILNTPHWSQETYCAGIPEGSDPFACEVSLNRLHAAAPLYPVGAGHDDPIAAAYFFTLAAYPDVLPENLALDSVVATRQDCSDAVGKACWTISPLPGVLSPVKARLVYIQTHTPGDEQTKLNLAWRLEVEMKDNYYEAYVSAHDPSKIIASIDWVKDAPAPRSDGWLTALQAKVFGESVLGSDEYAVVDALTHLVSSGPSKSAGAAPGGAYRVWKWGINDPASGDRTLEVSPFIKAASPLGWHSVPAGNDPLNANPGMSRDEVVNFTTTIGNNVIAQANWDGGDEWKGSHRPNGGPDLIFDFPYGANPGDEGWERREPRQYVNASITQLFYLSNVYHDLLYLYGFDEASGNFQQYNFEKGGAEGDGVIVDGQDSSGFNNANFLTPPDGTNGRCRMFIFNVAKPFRDGGLDAGILIHELSHGLSTRLTGGPSNVACLDTDQAGGMGEGWGDWIATTVRSTSTYSDFPIAAWAGNTRRGIRHFPYSTSKDVNPEMYDYLQRVDWREVHAIGEVWAEILWVVSNKLIEKHGFADSLFPSDDADFYKTVVRENGSMQLVPTKGNTLALQLVVNGMKLQPCNPTFAQARDAIIAADKALTGGENKCLLWAAFASRGLGTDAKKLGFATRPSINGFKVPPECE